MLMKVSTIKAMVISMASFILCMIYSQQLTLSAIVSVIKDRDGKDFNDN